MLSMHFCFKLFQSMFTRVEVEKSLVNFSVNLVKSSFMACLFALFHRLTFLLTGFLRAGRTLESTTTTSCSLMSGRGTHRFIRDGLFVPKLCRVLSIL